MSVLSTTSSGWLKRTVLFSMMFSCMILLTGIASAADYFQFLKGHDSNLYYATFHGFYCSRDNGATWELRNSDLFVNEIPATSLDLLPDGSLYMVGSRVEPGYIHYSDVYRSIDGGYHWTKQSTFAHDSWHMRPVRVIGTAQNTLVAFTPDGILGSADNGVTWIVLKKEGSKKTSVTYDQPVRSSAGTIIVEVQNSLLRSTDGVSWKKCATMRGAPRIASGPSGTWVAGSFEAGVFVSSDEGAHWKATHLKGSDIYGIQFLVQSPTTFYAYDDRAAGVIHQVAKQGKKWVEIGVTTSGRAAGVYLGTDQALYTVSYDSTRRTIDGKTWIAIGTAPSTWVNAPKNQSTLSVLPAMFNLAQNYPNPFNPVTHIGFSLPGELPVTMTVYDMTGKEVARLYNGETLPAGSHDVTVDAANLASGTYLYRVQAGKYTATRKLQVIK